MVGGMAVNDGRIGRGEAAAMGCENVESSSEKGTAAWRQVCGSNPAAAHGGGSSNHATTRR